MKNWLFYLICFVFALNNPLLAATEAEQSLTTLQGAFPLNASYTIDSAWGSGYQATVTISNNTANAVSSWNAAFTLPAGQTISSLWNGVYKATGQSISVVNPQWMGGGTIPPYSSSNFGMVVIVMPSGGTPALNSLLAQANGGSPTPVAPIAPVLNAITTNPSAPNNYTVSWNAVSNASSYTLQQDTTNSFSHPTIIAQGSTTSHNFTNQPNGTYYYRVLAQNSVGSSPYSNTQSLTINVVPIQLNPPVLAAINDSSGANQYMLNWSSVTHAQSYTVQMDSTAQFANPQTIYSGANTSYQVTGQYPGTYYYRVIAVSGNYTSVPSNTESVVVNQQTNPPSKTFVEAYWESWNSNDSIQTIVNMKVDVIDISFGTFTALGNHTYQVSGLDCDQATLTQFVAAAHQLGKKVKISIGGATYGLSGMLLTTQDATGMAQAIATFVQQNNLAGVDFDIEDYPAANLQVALIQATRQALGNNALISYTPKTPAATTAPYDQVIQGAYPYVTDISIMAYDYGSNYSYQQDIQALIAMGVPPSKLVIGLMPGYDDLHVMTSVSDITTAAEYVLSNNLAGIMFWDLNRDHENETGLGADAATNTAWNILH